MSAPEESVIPVAPQPQIQWAYETPLEPPEVINGEPSFTLDPRIIEINGMRWQARSDCKYKLNYYKLVERVIKANAMTKEERKATPLENELNLYRNYMQEDLFFFVYFVMKNPLANHPFIVEACKEVEAEQGDALHVWARDHLKTTIISVGRTCQKILNDPEKRIAIFAATRPLAIKIQNLIKTLFESEILKKCFPDILYENPEKEAPKWSESPEGGLIVKRKGFYKEATVSSWGLIEGMPTGDHYTDLVFDDIVTKDHLTPDMMEKVRDNFDMAENVGTRDTQRTVVGTFYRHDDPLTYIQSKRDPITDKAIFKVYKKPATVDGTYNGKAVFLPERTLAKKRSGKLFFFYCQQLLDPTPRGQEKLRYSDITEVSKGELPENLYRFMLIDGAGDMGRRQDRAADAWAMAVIGVEPIYGRDGSNRIYILDLVIEAMDLVQAQDAAVEMYCRNGRILKLGIEKVGMSTTEIHICNALKARGRHVSIERENLEILKPSGRTKEYRIESALSWPLKNGKIHILESVRAAYKERLKIEMDKFPAWHEDGLDAISYIYDIIKEYNFSKIEPEKQKEDPWTRAKRKAAEKNGGGWIAV